MSEDMGNVPSHWLPYFTVADCDQSGSKAQELGATVLQDPQGAVFAIIKMEPME